MSLKTTSKDPIFTVIIAIKVRIESRDAQKFFYPTKAKEKELLDRLQKHKKSACRKDISKELRNISDPVLRF